MEGGIDHISVKNKAALVADYNPDDTSQQPRIELASWTPVPAPDAAPQVQSTKDACAKTDGQWRAQLGCDADKNFQSGKAPIQGHQFIPDKPGDTPTPVAQQPGTPAPGYRPTEVTPVTADGDPNANGGSDIKVPKFHAPGYTQLAKAGPVSSDDFWQSENELITSTGRKIGHHTYEPWGYMGVGAVAGLAGETVLPWSLARRSNKILANMPPDVSEGKAQKSTGEQWAENYRRNFNSASQPRPDLDVASGLTSYVKQTTDLVEQQKQIGYYRDDLAKANEANGVVSNRLSKYAADHNIPITTEAEKAVFAEHLMTLDKDIASTLMTLKIKNDPSVRSFATPRNGFGLSGGMRGAAAVALGMVVDNYGDRLTSLLPDSVQSTLGLEDRDPHKGLSTSLAMGAILPLAYAADVAGKMGQPEGWKNWGINTGVALGATAIAGIGGHYLDAALGTNDLPTSSDRFSPNLIDTINLGLSAGFSAPTPTKLALAAVGWLDGRVYSAPGVPLWNGTGSHEVESVLWGAAAVGLSKAFVPKGMQGIAIAGTVASFGLGELNHYLNPIPNYPELNNAAWDALKNDQSTRTATSMTDAIDKFDRLSAHADAPDTTVLTFGSRDVDDGAVWSYQNDWISKNKSFEAGDIEKFRGEMILDTSLGESRLSRGTSPEDASTVITTEHFHTKYVPGLEGLGLDIGGDALLAFDRARYAASNALKATTAEDGKTHHDKVVSKDTEIADLKTVYKRVSGDIATILDTPHSENTLRKAIDSLSEYAVNEPKLIDNIRIKAWTLASSAQTQADAGNGYYRKVTAKSARDVAMVMMGEATAKADHHNATSGLAMLNTAAAGNAPDANGGMPQDAKSFLDLAAKYDPTNPDLISLKKIYAEKLEYVRNKRTEQTGKTTR